MRTGSRESKSCAIACAKAGKDGKMAWPCQEEEAYGREGTSRVEARTGYGYSSSNGMELVSGG